MMKAFLSTTCLVITVSLAAGAPPWEARIDVPLPTPGELPAIPDTNPFAQVLDTPPVLRATPLQDRYDATLTVEVAAYIDASGRVRRVVPVRTTLPGLETEILANLLETSFASGRAANRDTATWLTLGVDLSGRINRGRAVRIEASAPRAADLPEAVVPPFPGTSPQDLELPATPVEQLERTPSPRRFRTRVSSRTFRQPLWLLVKVDEQGKARQVVFLDCPEGLRPWLLDSLGGWGFQPATRQGRPVAAWAQVEGDLEVDLGTMSTETLRVIRQRTYPPVP